MIEINGKDAPGLLYRITRKMADLGMQIQMASVSTYGDRVVDVFYIKDGFGLKLTSETRINTLQRELLEVLRESDPAKGGGLMGLQARQSAPGQGPGMLAALGQIGGLPPSAVCLVLSAIS